MRWVLGTLISLLLLIWAFHGVDLKPLLQIFASMPLYTLPLMIGCIILFFAIKAVRWQLLLSPVGHYSTQSLVPPMLIGTAINYILFGFVGEFARTWILAKERSSKKSPLLMSIVLERIFDFWTLIFMLWLATMLSPHHSTLLARASYFLLALGLFATLLATLLVFFPEMILMVIDRLCLFLPKQWKETLLQEMRVGASGLHSIAHPKLLLAIVISSLVQWSFLCLCNWFAALAAGIQLAPWDLLGPMGLMILGMTLPSSPGQLGVIEMSYILGLSSWNVPKDQALAAGLLFHAVLYLSVIGVALVLSRRLGLSWRKF